MDFYNDSNNQKTEDVEMEPYARSGQGQENLNFQSNNYPQYNNNNNNSSSNQPAPYRNSGGFGGRGFYKSQNQQGNSMQYGNRENQQGNSMQYGNRENQQGNSMQYGNRENQQGNSMQYGNRDEYEDSSSQSSSPQFMSSQSSSPQYMGNTNQRGGSQYNNYKAQTSWRTQKFGSEQDSYRTGDAAENQSSPRGMGNKGYQKGGHWAGSNESFGEHQGSYNKDYRGRGRGGNVSSGLNSGGRGRGFYNSANSSNMAESGTYTSNTFEGRQNMGEGRGGYQKPENVKKNFQPNPQSFDSVKKNEPKLVEQLKKALVLPKKPLIQTLPKYNPPQATPSTVDANINKSTNILPNPVQPTAASAPAPEQKNEEEDSKSETKKRMPWKVADGGIRKRKKKTPAQKNLKVKKYVQPKNAVMCLNELVQGVVYHLEQEATEPTSPVCISVEVNGQKYRGFGSSRQMAKQAAAEAALVSFVKAPTSDTKIDDNTPWTVLACFAMYKLFNEWREGRIGMCHPGFTGASPFGIPMVQDATMSQSLQNMVGTGETPAVDEDKAQMSSVLAAYLGCRDGKKEDAKQVPNPAKQVPETAATMHPVMLLHQMRPQLAYIQSSVIKDNQQMFTLSCNIDNSQFVGEGSNLKKAKLELALKANKQLFAVESQYQAN